MNKKLWIMMEVGLLALLLTACGTAPTPPTIVVKETVIVDQEVTRVVEVEKEMEVTRVIEVEKEIVITATPEPPTPLPTPSLLFQDDFEDQGLGWDINPSEDAERFVEEGQFHIWVRTPMMFAWAGNPELQSLDDFALEVDATQVGGPDNNEYGIMFRYQGFDNWYAFLISSDGYFRLRGQFDGQDWNIVNWTQIASVKQGQSTNHLRLIADGPWISAYVNGELLATVPDNRFRRGDVNLVVGSLGEGDVHIAFDNLRITAID